MASILDIGRIHWMLNVKLPWTFSHVYVWCRVLNIAGIYFYDMLLLRRRCFQPSIIYVKQLLMKNLPLLSQYHITLRYMYLFKLAGFQSAYKISAAIAPCNRILCNLVGWWNLVMSNYTNGPKIVCNLVWVARQGPITTVCPHCSLTLGQVGSWWLFGPPVPGCWVKPCIGGPPILPTYESCDPDMMNSYILAMNLLWSSSLTLLQYRSII